MSKKKHTVKEFKSIQDQIKKSSLQDFEDWVSSNVAEMEATNEAGDTRKIFALTRKLSAVTCTVVWRSSCQYTCALCSHVPDICVRMICACPCVFLLRLFFFFPLLCTWMVINREER